MSSLPAASSGPETALEVQLQDVTQALAAARTQVEVLDAVLDAAVRALAATSGAVLLVDEDAQVLRVAAELQRPNPAEPLAVWQDGPLDAQEPAAEVLRTHQALYLEQRAGAVAAVPMVLAGRLLGSVVLAFREARPFTAEERAFLDTLAVHGTVALDRIRRRSLNTGVPDERPEPPPVDARAQDAFMALTEAVGSEIDLPVLVRQAIAVLQGRFPGASVGHYVQEGELWKAQVWSEDMTPELTAVITAGLPAETPLIARVLEGRQPVFIDGWNPEEEQISPSEAYASAAGYPLLVNGELHSLLAVGLRDTPRWSEADRGIVRAVGRSLSLALERTQTARRLLRQNAELQARTRALEAFAALTRDLALTSDPLLLIQRAQEVVMSMLTDGAAMYFEPQGDRWVCRVQSGDLQSPELQIQIDAGLPYAETHSLLVPWTTGQPYFQNVHAQRTDQLAPLTGHIAASATLPIRTGGRTVGVLAFGLLRQRTWSSVDRVLLGTAVQSLELALERAAQTRTLDEERVALEAFTRFTQQVGSELDVDVLVREAIALLQETCEVDVAYLELDGDLYRATAWNPGYDPALLSRLQEGFPLRRSNLALILRDHQVAFIDHWDAAGEWILESVHFLAVAGYPFFRSGELHNVLVMGSGASATWSERDKGIFRAVGRSLDLALERARQAQTLREQRDALAARTQELSVATEELQAFSYSVTHDLRTPVRHMIGFLELARKALDGKLDARSARYLDVVEQAGGQMNTLIDALLNLSQATQQPLRLGMVDLNTVVAQIKDTLMPDLLTRHIRWEVAPLPTVCADADAMKQVLTQLTENALKFTRSRDPAIIRVYAEDQGSRWGVFVQDNGLGFDPRYQDRLFNVFQRLHSAQEATGSGVGLASVRRLIAKHGGQVSAAGQPGEGATFGFSLPKDMEQARR
ncbi:GAF domain-containing protein [Deinococcus sonorensis]|uniref:histidine kinase n=2 Tax=Deinococcus sonorensis TaxID=309891 RepID=A0AAU7UCU2_9DEIO